MKKDLEQFIKEHREEFDVYEPPEYIWGNISGQLHNKPKRRILRLSTAVAAAILLVIGIAVGMLFKTDKTPDPGSASVPQKGKDTITEFEVYYASVVQSQQSEISRYCKDYPDMCKDFSNELDTLSSTYKQLKVQYEVSNNNEAVLKAMINNLQEQVKLLSLQLQIIQGLKEAETKNKPKTI